MRRKREQDSKRDDRSEPTMDGKRLELQDLNLPDAEGRGRARRFLRKLSEFLAGMYTGESCAGTPHSERKRGDSDHSEKDRRL